ALAVPPTGFGGYGNFSTSAGVVTVACPAGYTCANLIAAGTQGISQRKVTLVDRQLAGIVDGSGNLVAGATDLATGTSFFHTIVVDDASTFAGGNALNAIDFMAESFVGAQSNSNTIAAAGTVDLADGGLSTGRSTVDISRGFLLTANEPTDAHIVQTNATTGITVNFELFDNGPNSKRQRVDQLSGGGLATGGDITIRTSSGAYTCLSSTGPVANAPSQCGDGVIEMPNGNNIAYNAGDALQMVFMRLQNFGLTQPIVEVQSVRTAATQGALFSAPAQTWTSQVDAGVFVTAATGVGAWPFWDGNFGTAPNVSNVANGRLTFPQ
ncbi:MAG: hypothetical protein LBV36_03065, partial [Chromatiales bacterium]|nr:hypothetical protein [Chromatiales bacterium]